MVNVQTGRGGWFHNFGGLSTPISMWGRAYFHPGTFNAGFDVWVENAAFSPDNRAFSAELTFFGSRETGTVILCLDEELHYAATLDGAPVPVFERFPGAVELTLPASPGKHTLLVVSR